MNIVYEDDHIVVAYKEANILTQSSESGEKGLLEELSEHYQQKLHLIHRLDRAVSGLLVFARTSKAAAILSNSLSSDDFVKEYYALVYGTLEEQEGILEDLLYKDARAKKAYVVKRERNGVKKAKLAYKVEKTLDQLSLIHIHLYTGRFHQIRVQFSSRGLPLVGDGKYGAKDHEKRIALCAYHLSFKHPITKKPLDFQLDIQQEDIFRKYLTQIR
ncbi:MAG: RluA family pseudouridine synthase [Erysipelotrichaceae bacterium]|nr:RluA family pseudouridine synthase [Erysipelotrichaceae bacterium]MBQ9987453.1 RluA family pseudouridine synthase [Erysipelotrichales bacterium]